MKFWKFAWQHRCSIKDFYRVYFFARKNSHLSLQLTPVHFNFQFNDRKVIIALRPGTTDMDMFLEIFRRNVYLPPPGFRPKTIVDIGGNIGLTSLFFAIYYPEATIHVFEPIPANLEILRHNLEINGINRVIVHPFGLGDKEDTLTFALPEAGGYAGYSSSVKNASRAVEAIVRDTRQVFAENGLDVIDLLKVDCEGAEVAVLGSIAEQLSRINIVIGEIHTHLLNRIEVTGILSDLSRTHHVDFEKELGEKNFLFRASLKSWNDYITG